MATLVLLSKLFVSRPDRVRRHRLIERLNEGPHRDLTLISAPAGFGKTALVSECVLVTERRIAWLSLDRSSTICMMAYIDLSLRYWC